MTSARPSRSSPRCMGGACSGTSWTARGPRRCCRSSAGGSTSSGRPGRAGRARSTLRRCITDGSLDLLGQHLGGGPVDGRRFRMLIELAGGGAHEEDTWIGRRIELGETVMFVSKQVARCAITTQDPDTGARDLDTLRTIISYRGSARRRERRLRRVRRGGARGPHPSRRRGPRPRRGRAKRLTEA